MKNNREKEGFPVPKESTSRIHMEPHVAKYQQHFAYRSSRHQNRKTQQQIANRVFAMNRRWLGFPDILIQTPTTTFGYSDHGPILLHCCRGPTCLAIEAEQGEQLKQHALKDNKFGLLICWGFWVNSTKSNGNRQLTWPNTQFE